MKYINTTNYAHSVFAIMFIVYLMTIFSNNFIALLVLLVGNCVLLGINIGFDMYSYNSRKVGND